MNFKGNLTRAAAATVLTAGIVTWFADAQAFRMIQNGSTGRVTTSAAVACNNSAGFTHWISDNVVDFYHNTAGQGSIAGTPAALQAAFDQWTDVGSANNVVTYAGTTTAGWATDGRNTLLWAVGNGCTGNCLALTALVLQSGQVIIESDITFNNNAVWSNEPIFFQEGIFDIEAIAAHEVGHSLGIHHTQVTSSPNPTMSAAYFGTSGRTLESDDESALHCSDSRYPLPAEGAPSVPTNLRRVDKLCNGYYKVAWNASAGGVDTYRLFRSSGSSFLSQSLVSEGTSTVRTIAVGTFGIFYYRVRACNAAGCSGGYSNTLTLNGFSGCN